MKTTVNNLTPRTTTAITTTATAAVDDDSTNPLSSKTLKSYMSRKEKKTFKQKMKSNIPSSYNNTTAQRSEAQLLTIYEVEDDHSAVN